MPPFHIVIPARYESSRLPGKPLQEIAGRPMILHVVEQARRSAADTVCVATDHEDIARVVEAAGAVAVLTATDHPSGTDRVAEAADRLGFDDDAVIVNVQGDEPDMPPALIDQVARLLVDSDQAVMATASAPLDDAGQVEDPSVVKVVTDRDGYALYFSRATIPWVRQEGSSALAAHAPRIVRRHLGIYAYRCGYVKQFAARPACDLESYEKLEQLRVLWHGERIACAPAVAVPGPGVDTPEDLARVRREKG